MHPLALFGAAVMAMVFSPARIFGIVTAVAVHEAGHVAAGAILGVRVTGINVVPFGISFDMCQPRSYLHEALIAAAVAGVDLSSKADVANPVFTGSITIGNTTMTETQLDNLLSLESANGVSF